MYHGLSRHFSIRSTGTPSPPLAFRVQSKTSRDMTLAWTRGASNGLPLRNYTLQYRTESGGYEKADVYIAGELESYTLTGLTPDTKYYFVLTAVNDKGSYIWYSHSIVVIGPLLYLQRI